MSLLGERFVTEGTPIILLTYNYIRIPTVSMPRRTVSKQPQPLLKNRSFTLKKGRFFVNRAYFPSCSSFRLCIKTSPLTGSLATQNRHLTSLLHSQSISPPTPSQKKMQFMLLFPSTEPFMWCGALHLVTSNNHNPVLAVLAATQSFLQDSLSTACIHQPHLPGLGIKASPI